MLLNEKMARKRICVSISKGGMKILRREAEISDCIRAVWCQKFLLSVSLLAGHGENIFREGDREYKANFLVIKIPLVDD